MVKGRIVPARVFSRQMSRVGQAWMSVEVIVCFLMSERVRWWLLLGWIGRANAPEREARPPASLGGCQCVEEARAVRSMGLWVRRQTSLLYETVHRRGRYAVVASGVCEC